MTALPDTFERRGLVFEEFRLGLCLPSAARTITEADVVAFAGLSGDFTALHTDAVYAAGTAFRQRIAHGMLVQSIATGLGVGTGAFLGTIAALAGMTLEWQAPVFFGDTIRLELRVTALDPVPSKRSGYVTFSARVLNQDERVCVEGEWRTLILTQRAYDLATRRAASRGERSGERTREESR